jgi:hypothetical protein
VPRRSLFPGHYRHPGKLLRSKSASQDLLAIYFLQQSEISNQKSEIIM